MLGDSPNYSALFADHEIQEIISQVINSETYNLKSAYLTKNMES